MLAFRLLLSLAALAIVFCVGGWFVTGNRRWFTRALRIAVVTGVVSLVFFGVLLIERLAH